MTAFQFDQCFNDKKVIKACTAEGLAIAYRLPRESWGKSDPDLLAGLMASPHPVVTLDRALPTEHTSHIPASNPGIVVVGYSRDVPRTITTREGGKILRSFKDRVPTWHQLPLRNSIVEITEKSVEIWHIEATELVADGYFEFAEDREWVAQFVLLLAQNTLRHSNTAVPPSAPPAGQADAATE